MDGNPGFKTQQHFGHGSIQVALIQTPSAISNTARPNLLALEVPISAYDFTSSDRQTG
jgi:hypothetical protein